MWIKWGLPVQYMFGIADKDSHLVKFFNLVKYQQCFIWSGTKYQILSVNISLNIAVDSFDIPAYKLTFLWAWAIGRLF